MISKAVFDEHCAELKGVCFIAFLPHIYDSSASERKTFIEIFKDLAKSHRGSPVEFIWAQGGDHYELEEAFTLGSGYPALVAVSVNKERYAPFRGAFNKKGIDSFIKSIQNGKEPLFPLPNGFTSKINKVKAWDGKDAAPSTSTDDDL